MTRSFLISIPVLFLSALILTMFMGCESHSQTAAEHHAASSHDEPRPYDANANAKQDVANVLSTAIANDKLALIVMGANWCHDSRALAAHFEKDRFANGILRDHYQLLYVDVGQKDRNVDIAQSFGIDSIVGTPSVFIVDRDGQVLNLETAPTWRNAASRTEDEIAAYFEDYGQRYQPNSAQ